MDKPQPYQLWKQAEGDTERYIALMIEHGHIISREKESTLDDNERLIAATRRAHWHTFLAGPRTGPREQRVKWLPPIPVNVDDAEDLIPVIREVQ